MSRSRRSTSGEPAGLSLADIGGEVILLAGGARAILLQVANTAVGHGVADHSDFASRPLDRLRATMTYVYAVVYGSDDEKAFVRRRVNHAHVPVRKDASGDHPGYSAFDPTLQLWVAATLYETAVDLYQRVFGPLDAASADRIYRQYDVLGTALQVPAHLWPADRASFNAYWEESITRLHVDEAARSTARDLLHAARAPFWLRMLMPSVRLVTAGLLPATIRDQYRMPWGPREQRRFDRFMRVAASAYPRLPKRLRFLVCNRLMAALRRRMARGAPAESEGL